ncbi:MAG: glycoside hydrolase family 140 protein [Sedimentisphaerales bacterium]|nr:glycoside hydrolase family 140 protein [Sedimentisphaerales bacterium]
MSSSRIRAILTVAAFIVGAGFNACGAEDARVGPSVDFGHGDLKVSENKRFIVHSDGTPFFYLGDTAWELFHRLSSNEADKYLENRRQKGFTVIQAVVLAELDGLNTPNANGDRPLHNNDPKKPSEAYFKHVDYIVDEAREKGIYIGMLPTWGDKVTKAWGKGPVVFTPKNPDDAESYGRFLGNRFKDRPNIIWILGGDRVADGVENVWRAMAKGIEQGDKGRHLKTYHPQGGRSSAEWFHGDKWLDFNMLQSGHDRFDNDNYNKVSADYNRQPMKPCLDGEPRYEDHPVNWKPENGWFGDFDVRQGAYWAVFAGALGHTYGCHDIWQMYAPGRTAISSARNNWYDVLDLPGAWDMMHVRNLMESRPFISRVPDSGIGGLIAGDPGSGAEHISATRGEDYAFIYLPYGQNVKAALGKISGTKVKAWWFDPRTGDSQLIGEFENQGAHEFDPPGEKGRGNDWVLVLDDASKQFPKPGSR